MSDSVISALLLGGAIVLGYLFFDNLRLRGIVAQQQVVIATQQHEVEFLRETLMRYFRKEEQGEDNRERKEFLATVINELQRAQPVGINISGSSVSARDLVGRDKSENGNE